jgi:hypothetical protein
MLSPNTSYNDRVHATCDASDLSGAICTLNPAGPITVGSAPVELTASITVPTNAAPGVYNLIATAQDASGHPIHTATIPLTVIQDFSLSSSTAIQTVSPGQISGAYNLTLQPNPPGSSFPSPITLTCLGLPAPAQCIFGPSAPVTLGNSSASVVLNISTTASTGSLQPGRSFYYAAWLVLPGIVLAWAD